MQLHQNWCWKHLTTTVNIEKHQMEWFCHQFNSTNGLCCFVMKSICQTWTDMVLLLNLFTNLNSTLSPYMLKKLINHGAILHQPLHIVSDILGTQRVISYLRQMVEHGGFYRTSDQTWVKFERIQFVGACNPPTDPGRKPLSHRWDITVISWVQCLPCNCIVNYIAEKGRALCLRWQVHLGGVTRNGP